MSITGSKFQEKTGSLTIDSQTLDKRLLALANKGGLWSLKDHLKSIYFEKADETFMYPCWLCIGVWAFFCCCYDMTCANSKKLLKKLNYLYHQSAFLSIHTSMVLRAGFCLSRHARPLTYFRVHYFGPIEVVVKSSRYKRYAVIFTCLKVHLICEYVPFSLKVVPRRNNQVRVVKIVTAFGT